MRVPFFNHVSYDGKGLNYKKVEAAAFDPSRRFTVELMKNTFSSAVFAEAPFDVKPAVEEFQSSLNSYHLTGACDNRLAKEIKAIEKPTSLNSLQFDEEEQNKFLPAANTDDSFLLHEGKSFHGLAGEIVKTLEPYTEADSMALLLNTLVAFGNAIGRKAFFEADGSKHYTNLFSVLVGSTSAGKGTSWSQIKRLFESVDNRWSKNQI
jgi:hypothetical protein